MVERTELLIRRNFMFPWVRIPFLPGDYPNKDLIKKRVTLYKIFGRGGIRTHGNSRHIGFQNQHHRPLGHPSIKLDPHKRPPPPNLHENFSINQELPMLRVDRVGWLVTGQP